MDTETQQQNFSLIWFMNINAKKSYIKIEAKEARITHWKNDVLQTMPKWFAIKMY